MLDNNLQFDTSDDALVKRIPGFENRFATVNGVTLHYVIGGKGPPLILLPGHPETWWAYHQVMTPLSERHTVVVVDIRGMGSSEAPEGGYDKKTMAEDVYQLIGHLGFTAVNIAGHDIGAMVAFSLAANHPEVVTRLALLDVPHPDESWYEFSMLPREGKFGDKIDAEHPPYPWWFAFHQVRGLDEALLAGNGMRTYIAWLFNYMLADRAKIEPIDLAVYGDAYSSPDGIRAGHAWYQAWPRDINDQKEYAKVTMPILGLGAEHTGWHWLQITKRHATDVRLEKIEGSGHFLVMEQPERITEHLLNFFDEISSTASSHQESIPMNTSARIALVTGATRGIGLETVRQLAAQGVHTLLAGRSRDKAVAAALALQAEGLPVEAIMLDVTDAASIAAAVIEIEQRHGRLDILVNNAGILLDDPQQGIAGQSIDTWRKTFETNVFGLIATTQALLPLLHKSTAGRIVNVSSLLGSITEHQNPASPVYPIKFIPAYNVSKTTVNAWTVHLAHALRDTPIKVNAIHPGAVKTDGNPNGEIEVSEGAKTSVALALIGADGPNGSFMHLGEALPW